MTSDAAPRVELLLSPGCPNAAAARTLLRQCLDRLGLDRTIAERVGNHPSPTVLVDGVDVMNDTTSAPLTQACRLDVPTVARVMAALSRRSGPTAMSEKG